MPIYMLFVVTMIKTKSSIVCSIVDTKINPFES